MPLRREKAKPVAPPLDAFKRRLVRAMELGGLTVADLQHWFERSYATVYSWVHGGKTPRPSFRTDDLEARLRLLEIVLDRNDGGFPVPTSLSQFLRAGYVKRIFRDARGDRIARSASWRR